MRITDDGGWAHVMESGNIVQRLLKRRERLGGLQITNVLTKKNVMASCGCNRIFDVRTYREDRRLGSLSGVRRPSPAYGQGCVAACASQHQLPSQHDADDRIVDMAGNRSVVHQENVSNVGEPVERVMFLRAQRFINSVATGGHHRKPQSVQQQMMQRRVRQHHAEFLETTSDGSRDARVALAV